MQSNSDEGCYNLHGEALTNKICALDHSSLLLSFIHYLPQLYFFVSVMLCTIFCFPLFPLLPLICTALLWNVNLISFSVGRKISIMVKKNDKCYAEHVEDIPPFCIVTVKQL